MIEKLQETSSPYTEKNDPWSSHSIILAWLFQHGSGTKILDIGTATGMLGKKLVGSGFNLKGIEPVNEWALQAKPYYEEVLCTSLDACPDVYLSGYDLIVCGDVLEHLSYPWETMKHLVGIQEPNTEFLISVPNVANIWMRVNLLFGRFDYTAKGILDRTHLRFFTKRSFLSFLSEVGLKVLEIRYSPIPLNLVNPFFVGPPLGRILFRLLNLVTQKFPTLLAYQFVVRTAILKRRPLVDG